MGADKEDKINSFAAAYFFIQGVGTLVGWNGVLNGLGFFSEHFEGLFKVDFAFPVAVYFANMAANFAIIPLSKKVSLDNRVSIPLAVVCAIMGIIPVITHIFPNATGFWIVMFCLFILGFCNNIFMSSISGICAKMPGYYFGIFMGGTGLAGIIMNVLRAISLLTFDSLEDGALIGVFVYFGAAVMILIFCVFLHFKFVKSDIYDYYMMKSRRQTIEYQEVMNIQDSITTPLSEPEENTEMNFTTLFQVLGKVKLYVGLMLLLYIQTFMMFPGVMLDKPIPGMKFDWKVVSMIFTYNLFDTIGKFLTKRRDLFNKCCITALVLARFWFFFTFLIAATTMNVDVFDSTWFAYVNIALFALTNGYATSALFTLIPEQLQTNIEKEISGFLGVWGLTGGIMCGAFLALPFANLDVPTV